MHRLFGRDKSSPVDPPRNEGTAQGSDERMVQASNEGTVQASNNSGSLQLHYGVARVIGSRPYQEDEYTCINNLPNGGAAYFAIFDGHASDAYSADASDNTHNFVFGSDAFKQGDYCGAILEGLKKQDARLYEKFHNSELGGTTATICLIVGNTLYLGNLGDSSSVLAMNQNGALTSVRISYDHKPDDPNEKARIEAVGGQVVGDRVMGPVSAINMSRAMGDFSFKMPMNRQAGDWIESTPYIMPATTITPDMQFLILASDGLWNVMGDRAVAVVQELKKKGKKPEEIAKIIANECGSVPSADNTTVMIVFFDFIGNMFKDGNPNNGAPLISAHSVAV